MVKERLVVDGEEQKSGKRLKCQRCLNHSLLSIRKNHICPFKSRSHELQCTEGCQLVSLRRFCNRSIQKSINQLIPESINQLIDQSTSANEINLTSSGAKTRQSTCALCQVHGLRSNTKGHKLKCPYRDCDCELCTMAKARRAVMAKQVNLRRRAATNSTSTLEESNTSSMEAMQNQSSTQQINDESSINQSIHANFIDYCLQAALMARTSCSQEQLLSSLEKHVAKQAAVDEPITAYQPKSGLTTKSGFRKAKSSSTTRKPGFTTSESVPIDNATKPVFPVEQLLNATTAYNNFLSFTGPNHFQIPAGFGSSSNNGLAQGMMLHQPFPMLLLLPESFLQIPSQTFC